LPVRSVLRADVQKADGRQSYDENRPTTIACLTHHNPATVSFLQQYLARKSFFFKTLGLW
jgi:hypothetical protein